MPKEWVKCRFPVFTSRDSDSLSLMWGQVGHHQPPIHFRCRRTATGLAFGKHCPPGSGTPRQECFSTHWPVSSGIFLSQNAYHLTKFYSQNYWSPFAFAPTKSEEDLSVVDSSTWTQKNRWESSCSDQMTKLSLCSHEELENPYLAFLKVSVKSSNFWPPIETV